MGKFSDWWFGSEPSPSLAPARYSAPHRFHNGDDWDLYKSLVNGYSTFTATRAEALMVPAIKRARDVFASIAMLPLHARDAAGLKVDRVLLDQPEKFNGLTRGVTMAMTADDLFFYGQSLWKVVDRDYTAYPTVVDRVDFGRWSIDANTGTVTVDGTKLNQNDAIVFSSPNEGLLATGGPTIKALHALEALSAMYTARPEMTEYFTPAEGMDPDPDEISDFLADWDSARRAGTTGFIPSSVNRNEVRRMTPEELQLSSAKEFGILQAARLTGLPPTWLGVPVTTRTYANAQDERRDIVDFVAKPYLLAIEERLSLNDVCPRGQRVKFNLDAFLRGNTNDRYAAHAIGIDKGFLTVDEVRELEDRAPLEGDVDG